MPPLAEHMLEAIAVGESGLELIETRPGLGHADPDKARRL
jgi:hypothetical protein